MVKRLKRKPKAQIDRRQRGKDLDKGPRVLDPDEWATNWMDTCVRETDIQGSIKGRCV